MLKSRKALNKISLKRLEELNGQVSERIALCWRCGGKPYLKKYTVYIDGQSHALTTVICMGGYCELCHRPE